MTAIFLSERTRVFLLLTLSNNLLRRSVPDLVWVAFFPMVVLIEILLRVFVAKAAMFPLRLMWGVAMVQRFAKWRSILSVRRLHGNLLPIALILSLSYFTGTHVSRLGRLAILLDFNPGWRLALILSSGCHHVLTNRCRLSRESARLHIPKRHHVSMAGAAEQVR